MNRTVSMWGTHGPRPTPLAQNDPLFESVSAVARIEVACAPAQAWALITDVTRIGEFSPECIDARWIEGSGPSVGARFEGTNRVGNDDYEFVWIRPCTITAADEPKHFAYTVGDRYDGSPASEWDFAIEPAGDGCAITQTFRHVPDGITGVRVSADAEPDRAAEIIQARLVELRRGMTETLGRMKAVLEDDPDPSEAARDQPR